MNVDLESRSCTPDGAHDACKLDEHVKALASQLDVGMTQIASKSS